MAEGEESDDAQKTEDATPKKMEESRKRGQVPMSKETNVWFMLLISTLVIVALIPAMTGDLAELLRKLLDQSWQVHGSPGVAPVITQVVMDVIGIMFLPIIVLFVAAFIGPLAQIGPLFAPESIIPKLSKLSLVQGFGRLFSKKSLFEFIKGIIKVLIVGVVSVWVLEPYMEGVEHLIDLSISDLLSEMMILFIKLMSATLMVLFILAGADLLFQRYTFMQQMRMTKQEIKDEYKQTEGDPHVKSRLRQLRMERSRNRMMQNVPSSTVVVTNPTHFAVCLKYEPDEMDVPVCVAKGQDLVALRIRQVAEENGVVIVENPPLARTLFKVLEIDDTIPAEHYKAVAEVISYVFRLKKKM